MAKAPRRRRATGRLRRGPLSSKSSYRRTLHLSVEEMGYLQLLQTNLTARGRSSQVAAIFMYPLLMCLILAQQNIILTNCPNATVVMNCLLCLQQLNYWKCVSKFKKLLRIDTRLHDIPLEQEANAPPSRMPRQNIRFHS